MPTPVVPRLLRKAANGPRLPLVVVPVLILVAAALLTLAGTGRMSFAYERIVGQPEAILEEVAGPETGPPCSIDQRYVDEAPEGLRPDVLDAWNRLRTKAGAQGTVLCVQDSKRSTGQQQREFTDAVGRFGTPDLASKYVLTPEKSMHVKGIAVDIQPLESAAWVEHNGRELGWCRRYENEEWHFEYDPSYPAAGCPALLPSATG